METKDEVIANFLIITGCKDDEKAMHYLQMSNFQLEAAISLYMELENQQHDIQHQQFQPQQQVQTQQTIHNQQPQQPEQSAVHQALAEKYRHYLQNKPEDGMLTKIWSNTKSAWNNLFNRQPNYGEEFQKFLQSKKIKIEIRFQMGLFSENLQNAAKDFRPLLVYIHEPQHNEIIQSLFNCKNLVNVVNKNYTCYGFLANAETIGQIPQVVETPCIVIYRVSFIEEIVQMAHFKLTNNSNFEEIAKEIKQLRGAFNKTYLQEELVKKQIENPQQYDNIQLNGFNMYQNQQEQIKKQQQQQKERELLRQQQEEAFRQAEQIAKEQQKINQEKQFQQQQQIEQQQKQEEQRLLKKAALLSSLPEQPENDGICIRFMFADGIKTRNFRLTDKIQTLFDFVECQEDECFNDPKATIDLIQNFPRLSLKDKKDLLIEQVFQDSLNEQLIVEEIE